jgi:UDP-glucuronate 4-epimerase
MRGSGSPEAESIRMKFLVTGAAGFIGSYVSHALLDAGHAVIGVDELNAYYDPRLKQARLARLGARAGFSFHKLDIADDVALGALPDLEGLQAVIHLAAQAGVRNSIENPMAYARSNLVGHLSVLELVRHLDPYPLLIYASSSSVYGDTTQPPFSERARAEEPVSLYAATKRADELLSYTYAHLYGMPQIGLRFFTVYGPWGRPDMAYWSFSERILSGTPIQLFNHGDLKRDFTYIDDIVEGVVRIALQPPNFSEQASPHRLYNIGNNQPVELMTFVRTLEHALGKSATLEFLPMQPGDVHSTCADIAALNADYGFAPRTPIEEGLQRFADWFRAYRAAP